MAAYATLGVRDTRITPLVGFKNLAGAKGYAVSTSFAPRWVQGNLQTRQRGLGEFSIVFGHGWFMFWHC
jgi:hypothetical protein